ncbi:MAG TPA: MazG family protein [Acidimicrobiales bacterium]|nr:MazG family protein [Acidimicrobiales bacterium]
MGASREPAGRVTVVGLGPSGPDLLTAATLDAIERVRRRFLRTVHHPAAVAVPDAASFDHLYESGDTFDAVYAAIVEELVAAAGSTGEVLYAVPGNPRVLERSVELLLADGRVEVEVLPAMSFLDLAWVRLGIDPVEAGVRLVDGHRFEVDAAGERGPLLVAHCHNRRVLSDIKLAVDGDGTDRVLVLQRLGLPDEAVTEVAWDDLDRVVEPDHLTSLYIPVVSAPVALELTRFVTLVRTLRAECPWDREQTHRSLTRHLLEETYEVLEAIEALDPDTGEGYGHLEEELGDLLFQVVFHATLGAEAGQLTMADVARGIHDKLVRRHPHVFAGLAVSGTDDVVTNWEQIKKEEKGRASVMDGVPGNLPSLLYAHKVLRKASSIGHEPELVEGGPLAGAAPVDDGPALGALLLAAVQLARRLDVDPEAALRAAAMQVRDRVAALEAAAAEPDVP